MKINVSFTETFDNLIARLREKYPEEIFDINGISAEKMDVMNFSNKFFHNSANLSDISVDGNANVSERSMVQYNYEINKGLMRMKGLAMLHKQIEDTYTTVVADNAIEKVINGELFVNDLHLVNLPYCYAFDIAQLLIDGMDFYGGMMKIKPPKRSDSLIDLVIQTTASLSNQLAGACLHKDQRLLIRDNGINKSIKIKDLVNRYDPTDYFENNQGKWYNKKIDKVKVYEDGRFVNVNRVYKRKYNDDIYVIKTASGKEIKTSKDHKFKVLFRDREIEVKAKDLKVYDTVFNTNNKLDHIDKNSNDYKWGQYIGLIAGDGSLRQKRSIRVAINYSQKFIAEWLDDFSENILGKKGVLYDGHGCYSYQIHSKEILEKTKSFFNGDDTLTKHIDVENKSMDFLLGFLDGILTADGGYNSCHKISLINEKLINNIKDILNMINFSYNESFEEAHDNKQKLYIINFKTIINRFLSLTNEKRKNNEKYISCRKKEISYYGRNAVQNSRNVASTSYIRGYSTPSEERLPHLLEMDVDTIISIEKIKNDDEFVYEIETETGWYSAGGILTHNCSYPSLFILIDAFYRKENGEDYMNKLRNGDEVIAKKIRDQFQKLIYSLNFTFRGNQSAFTNVSVLDDGFLDYLFDETYVLPNGWEINKPSTKQLSMYFYEYFSEINMKEGMFTFPVVTIALSVDDNNEFIDKELVEWTAKVNSHKSLANIMIDKPTSFSSCCRLRNDFTKLNAYGRQNSFGVGGVQVGSHRVVGLNLPRIAMSGNNIKNKTSELLSTTKIILDAHRDIISNIIDSGALPLYTKGWMSLSRQYSTVGFVGLYEFMNELGISIDSDDGIQKASDFMGNIESIVESWQTRERLYNIEQIPAESTAVRLAKIDQLLVDGKYNIYSNQYLPLTKEASIYNRIKLQGVFDKNTSGGAILHINFDESKPMLPEIYMKIMDSARELGCKYFGINYVFSKCENDHYVISNGDMCPVCGGNIVDKYTRVVGFLTSVNNWNQVRREEEFPNRKFTTTEGIMGDL